MQSFNALNNVQPWKGWVNSGYECVEISGTEKGGNVWNNLKSPPDRTTKDSQKKQQSTFQRCSTSWEYSKKGRNFRVKMGKGKGLFFSSLTCRHYLVIPRSKFYRSHWTQKNYWRSQWLEYFTWYSKESMVNWNWNFNPKLKSNISIKPFYLWTYLQSTYFRWH